MRKVTNIQKEKEEVSYLSGKTVLVRQREEKTRIWIRRGRADFYQGSIYKGLNELKEKEMLPFFCVP